MKVVHLVISLDCGGLERLVVDWTNARNRRAPGSTAVICLDAPGDLSGEVEGGAVYCLNARRRRFPFDISAVRRLRQQLSDSRLSVRPETRNQKPETCILHSHNLAAQQYACLACLGGRVRHVNTEHGTNIHTRGISNRLRLQLLARLTDITVAVSEDTAMKMRSLWKLPPNGVNIIPNGVSPHPHYSREAVDNMRRALGIPAEAIVFGSVGRMAKVKGYDRLVEALPYVFQRVPCAFCLLVGDGPERRALEEQAKRLGVSERVIFAGYRADARIFFEIINLFVLPSRSEGLSVALLEAMAAGLPVVVTRAGENPRIVEDGLNGFFLPENMGSWPHRLAALAGDNEPGARAGEAARRTVIERFCLDRTLDAYEQLYAGDRA